MTVSDGATFYVDNVLRQPEFLRKRDHNGREGFVDLDSIEIADSPPRASERLTHGGDRSEAKHSRLDRADAV